MEYDFHKSKLPKGLSYPVKRSVLDKILEDSGTAGIKWVSYSVRNRDSIIIWATFLGEAHKATPVGRIGLYIYAVPSDERKRIEAILLERGFPKLVEWLEKLESAGEGWRSKSRQLEIEYKQGEISFAETE